MAIQIIGFLIVLAIVFYFLRQEHKKEQKYFGKKVAPSRNEQKILKKYQSEYNSIKADNRLAQLDKDKWELEDIAKSATEVIYDAPLPTKTQRENLKTGDLVKLKFIIDEDGVSEIERIWVKVKLEKDGLYAAELDNDPISSFLKAGQLVWLHPNHVFQIENKSK